MHVAASAHVICLDVFDHLICIGKGETDHRIRTPIVNGHPSGVAVDQCGAGEGHVGHIACALVGSLWRQQVGPELAKLPPSVTYSLEISVLQGKKRDFGKT